MLRYRSALSVLCAVVFFSPCFGQTQPTFQSQTQSLSIPGNTEESNTFAIDLNNDGIPDLIQTSQSSTGGVQTQVYQAYLAKGDGTFTAGYQYTTPANTPTCNTLASGDFNGDGNADIVIPLYYSNQVAVLFGKGDGTFQAPKLVTIAPSGWLITACPVAASDFNRDGKLDLIVALDNPAAPATMLSFLPGNGDGTFGTASTIATPSNLVQVMTGDFDGDAIADVTYTDNVNCQEKNCATVLHVMYGRGDGTFEDTTPLNSQSYINIGTGDLNSDGKTDIFTIENTFPTSNTEVTQLATLYGQSDRTFSTYTQNLNSYDDNITSNVAFTIADFNGDGLMDIVTTANPQSGPNAGLHEFLFFLATSNPGVFTEQTVSFPQTLYSINTPVVGNFVKEPFGQPSAVFEGAEPAGPTLFEALNTTNGGFWGGCAFPTAGQGFNFCAPTTIAAGSPFVAEASANSFGNLRKIELWVNGKKVGEQYHAWGQRAWFYSSSTYATGSYTGTLYAVDTDNRKQQYNFNFTVGSACAPPSSAGVHVCSPINGGTNSSPVLVQAAATIAGTLNRMEIWVDGVKKYTETANTFFSTTLSLPTGSHRFDIYAVNSAGTKYETTVTATVN